MTTTVFIKCEIPSHYSHSNTLPIEEQPVWNIVSQEVSHRIWTGGEATVLDEKIVASGLTLRGAEEKLRSILASPAGTDSREVYPATLPNGSTADPRWSGISPYEFPTTTGE
jgi:hypothetical protein